MENCTGKDLDERTTLAAAACQLGKILDQTSQQQHLRARWNCDDQKLRRHCLDNPEICTQKITGSFGKNFAHSFFSDGLTARTPPCQPPMAHGRVTPSPTVICKRRHLEVAGK